MLRQWKKDHIFSWSSWSSLKSLVCVKPMSSWRCCLKSRRHYRFIGKVGKKFLRFSEICLALRYQPCVILSVDVKKKLHIHFLQFFRGPLTQHLKVRFFPQPNLEWRLPIIRFSDSTTEYYTLRSECETSLGRYQTRAGRDSFSVQRNSTLIVFRTVLVWNSLSKFKASNLIRFLLLSLLGWCVE